MLKLYTLFFLQRIEILVNLFEKKNYNVIPFFRNFILEIFATVKLLVPHVYRNPS